ECTREGVNLIDNNIIWNVEGRFDPARIPAEPGSSGWYKLRETEAVNGYAVYAEGTDRLYIAHNLIGKCRYGGYYAKPVGFRMSAFDRGGTSRKASVINNIFYDCGEAAICFPTEDNRAEGNLYIRMKGGYLRVMYPEPETCLNLPAWQEFYGFDREGQFAWLDLEPEGDFGKVRFAEAEMPSVIPDMLKHLKMITAPEGIRPVAADPMVDCDRTGAAHPEGSVLPGPFNALA
ncbi:MAG: right-handed parallel beta-helix repeat-containing protein, partial [Clostridia bacterium]|nr:right-handed parallel beta-helix repeat-containing protein [Clostridia bacterium]